MNKYITLTLCLAISIATIAYLSINKTENKNLTENEVSHIINEVKIEIPVVADGVYCQPIPDCKEQSPVSNSDAIEIRQEPINIKDLIVISKNIHKRT